MNSYTYNGYRTYFKDIDRGSIVTERSMLLQNTPEGLENKGFDLEFVMEIEDKIYMVREVRIRSFIEICAFILGSIAGFVFIARVLKFYLGDQEYFRAKDRECDMLFGSSQNFDSDPKFKAEVELVNQRNKRNLEKEDRGQENEGTIPEPTDSIPENFEKDDAREAPVDQNPKKKKDYEQFE